MITFQRITVDDFEAFTYIARWDNDPELAEFLRPNFSLEPLPQVTAKQLHQAFIQNHTRKHLFLIKANGEPIGNVSLEANFFMLLSRPDAAWVSLCIGEAAWRGKGIGQQALAFVEAVALEQGYALIELGVFAYNIPAKALYLKCGYEQFATIPDFVYYQGQKYADLRLKKQLIK